MIALASLFYIECSTHVCDAAPRLVLGGIYRYLNESMQVSLFYTVLGIAELD